MDVINLEGRVFNDFKFIKKIGKGSFGVVYEAQYQINNKKYAIKTQSNKTLSPQINFEYQAYIYLHTCFRNLQDENLPIPKVYGIFSNKEYTFFVMDLLGKSLYDVFKENNRCIQPIKAINYAKKMIGLINIIHRAQIVYRDIKPQNFIFVEDDSEQLKLVDFGLCKRTSFQNQKYKKKQSRSVIGTSRYASISAHQGKKLTRKDDIESLIYVLIYLMRGFLPWQGIKADSQREKNNMILKMKKTISAQELCEDLPFELQKLVNYIREEDKLENNKSYQYISVCLDDCLEEIRANDAKDKDKLKCDFEQGFFLQNGSFNSLRQFKIQFPLVCGAKKPQSAVKQLNTKQIKHTPTQPIPLKKEPIKKLQIKKQFILNDASDDQPSSQNQPDNYISKFID